MWEGDLRGIWVHALRLGCRHGGRMWVIQDLRPQSAAEPYRDYALTEVGFDVIRLPLAPCGPPFMLLYGAWPCGPLPLAPMAGAVLCR